MITFTSLGGSSVGIAFEKQNIVLFPEKDAAGATLQLLASPEEELRAGAISWPGEYDVSGITIRGIGHGEGKFISYLMEVDGVRIACLSAPLQDWADHEVNLLGTMGDVEVMLLPSDRPSVAQKLVDEVDPRLLIVLPNGSADDRRDTLKFCGAQGKETVTEYKLKGSLPAEGREVVVF